MTGAVYLVGAGPGAPDLLTLGTLEAAAAESAGGPVLILLGGVYREALASQIIESWNR